MNTTPPPPSDYLLSVDHFDGPDYRSDNGHSTMPKSRDLAEIAYMRAHPGIKNLEFEIGGEYIAETLLHDVSDERSFAWIMQLSSSMGINTARLHYDRAIALSSNPQRDVKGNRIKLPQLMHPDTLRRMPDDEIKIMGGIFIAAATAKSTLITDKLFNGYEESEDHFRLAQNLGGFAAACAVLEHKNASHVGNTRYDVQLANRNLIAKRVKAAYASKHVIGKYATLKQLMSITSAVGLHIGEQAPDDVHKIWQTTLVQAHQNLALQRTARAEQAAQRKLANWAKPQGLIDRD